MSIVWFDAVDEALRAETDKTSSAITASSLRAAVEALAASRSLDFPPPELRRFLAFVESYPSAFVVRHRDGQDALVAPADRPELLDTAPPVSAPAQSAARTRLRADLYEALTRVPGANNARPYYLPDSDAVSWFGPEITPPAAAIAIPAATEASEVAARRRFIAESGADDTSRADLEASLELNLPLSAFSRAVRAAGLNRRWHQFRIAELSGKLKEWADERGVATQASWFDQPEPRPQSDARRAPEQRTQPVARQTETPAAVSPRATSHRSHGDTTNDKRRALIELANRLSDDDIARITVPLDVVLKLI